MPEPRLPVKAAVADVVSGDNSKGLQALHQTPHPPQVRPLRRARLPKRERGDAEKDVEPINFPKLQIRIFKRQALQLGRRLQELL